jgi:hypothetical protein
VRRAGITRSLQFRPGDAEQAVRITAP